MKLLDKAEACLIVLLVMQHFQIRYTVIQNMEVLNAI